MDKLINLLNSIPIKLMGMLKKRPQQQSVAQVSMPQQTQQTQQTPTIQLPRIDLPAEAREAKNTFLGKINKKEVVILGGLFFIIVILALLAAVFKIRLPIPGFLEPSPTPVVTPAPVVTPVPRYFNDADILKIEENTTILENELNNIDIEESNIQPRPLDWEINFKK